MSFHLVLFSLTLSDLERSDEVTRVFNGLYVRGQRFLETMGQLS